MNLRFECTNKRNLHSKKNRHGFSLVELMVVVSIIGVLAAIGIPQYSKFKQNAYSAEAKSALANLFVAEKAFYLEHSGYHTSFQAIGFTPAARGVYNVGFGGVGTPPPDYTSIVDTTAISSKAVCNGFGNGPANSDCTIRFSVPDLPVAVDSGTTYFYAAAVSTPALYANNDLVGGHPLINMALNSVVATAHAVATPEPPTQNASMGNTVDAWTIDHLKVIKHQLTWHEDCPNITTGYPACNGGTVKETYDGNQCLTGWVCEGGAI